MSDRRKARRFVFETPAKARLHVLQDVVIERSNSRQLTVLATASSSPGEELAMRIRAGDGRTVTLTVCTVTSRPVMIDGTGLRYRLDLRVLGAEGPPASPAGVD
jgi:hypothetical protein